MRILYDSKKLSYKTPFGTLTPGEACTLHIHIPTSVGAVDTHCVFSLEDGSPGPVFSLKKEKTEGPYDIFSGTVTLSETGLYFYYFRIFKAQGSFRLFKQGDDTNMEAGDCWQLSCVPKNHKTPHWAQGAPYYQIFPDRFCKSGDCDLSGKLAPYLIHGHWDEEVQWAPNAEGLVLNNDFYGGNFRGITEKLPYIASLGCEIIYLNPICKGFSNHRYDTGDYKTPDPMLGTMEDFQGLCQRAHSLGLRVIFDGVFSHTGSDSLYFNRKGSFGEGGAYRDKNSPYKSWYQFISWPNIYNGWWGFDTLPTVNKLDPSFMEYIITGEDSVIAHWLKAGCDGFRLDVADELPNGFMLALKTRLRELNPQALLLGEVWEDASNKISYGSRRRYFVDGTLDSVMNYPFRSCILNFLWGRDDGRELKNRVMTILENYPPQVIACNMNMLGTHDTPRILTTLVDGFDGSRAEKAMRYLNGRQLTLAMSRLYLASALQYMLPGCPSVYYGDEAQMEGYADPFNRRTFPWGRENLQLQDHYKTLGWLRKSPVLRYGSTEFLEADGGVVKLARSYEGKTVIGCFNCSYEDWQVPTGNMLYSRNVCDDGNGDVKIRPLGFCIIGEL